MRGSWLLAAGIVLLALLLLAYNRFASEEIPDGNSSGKVQFSEVHNTDTAVSSPGSVNGRTASAEISPATNSAEQNASRETPPEMLLFPKWPKPDYAFIVTGEMNGSFEPCGCTANQLGGMNRRADLFKQVNDLGWTVRGLDVGRLPRRTGRQAQVKFETTLAAMRDLQYIATGIGPEELRLDPGFLISQHVVDGDNPLYFLSANLVFYGVADLGTPKSSRIVDLNGHKVGVTSVMPVISVIGLH